MMIRTGRVEERLELEELQRRALLAHDDQRRQLLDNPDIIELPRAYLADSHVRVAETGGRVLGFTTLLPRGPRLFVLDALFVEPGDWRKGIGLALMGDVHKRLAMGGGGWLQTVANPRAEGFYEKLGFTAQDSAMTPLGPARRMALEIPAYSAPTRQS